MSLAKLDRKDLTPALEAELKVLQNKALTGKLKKGELSPYRKRTQSNIYGMKSFLSNLQRLRKRGANIKAYRQACLNISTTQLHR